MTSPTMAGFRLSPQQRRMWSLRRLFPALVARAWIRVEGELDPDRLRAALRALVARRESLRTTIRVLDRAGLPLQVVSDNARLDWRLVETGNPDTLFETERVQTADLEAGPVLRARLLRLGPREWCLSLCMPALCGDGATLRILAGELAGLLAPDPDPALSEPEPVSHVQYSEWLHALMEEDPSEEGPRFWKTKGTLTLTSVLPWELRPREAEGIEPHSTALSLPETCASGIQALAEALGIAGAMVPLGAMLALLRRLGETDRVGLGVVADGRRFEEFQTLTGPVSRWFPLTLECGEGESGRALLKRVAEAHDAGLDWMDWFEPDRDDGGASRPVLFEYQDLGPERRVGGLRLAIQRMTVHQAPFRLKLDVSRGPLGMEARLHYDGNRFRPEDAERLLSYYRTLLLAILAEPATPIGHLPMLSTRERRHLLFEYNRSGPAVREPCLPRVLADRATALPDRVAVVYADRHLCYAALRFRARTWGKALRSKGIGPESRVALWMARGVERLTAMWGVWVAGGAFVPLSRDQPTRRLETMVRDAGLSLAVTDGRDWGLPDIPQLLAKVLEAEHGHGPAAYPESSQCAYVLFTSGSTGQPKAVTVSHGNIANYGHGLARTLRDLFSTGPLSFATVGTFAADLGYTSVFGASVNGGTLYTASRETAMDPDRFGDFISGRHIDVLKIVPSHFQALLSQAGDGAMPRRALILGGETFSAALYERLRASARCPALINHYGPTETAVGCAALRVSEKYAGERGIPIGKPLPGTRLYLVDRHGHPRPEGLAGHLLVGGAGVARGYLARPALTASRFLPDPFGRQPGTRLYATGDRARYLPGGALLFLGRNDHQVKVHGFRVEPGEIEAALLAHRRVREAVAGLSGSREPVLTAWLVCKNPVAPEELRDYLAERLPPPMLPRAWVFLASLPLTANGKVDRHALPAPGPANSGSVPAYAAPRTQAERDLTDIWARILGRGRVGIHDNFFALGGDSILSIQIVFQAHRAGWHIDARQMFRYQTVAELAAAAEPVQPDRATVPLPTGNLPLTPIQQRFFQLNPVDPHHYNQALLLAARAPLNPRTLERAVAYLEKNRDSLRLRFRKDGPAWRQYYRPAGQSEACFGLFDLSGLPRSSQTRVLTEVASAVQASFDLLNGPLFRAVFFRLSPELGDRVLLVCHHLVVDGVSWRILLEELHASYRAFEAGAAPQEPEPATAYGVWALRLAEYAALSDPFGEAETWRDLLQGPWAALPCDSPAGANTHESARSVEVSLSAEETQALLERVPGAYRTRVEEVLLAALAMALRTHAGKGRWAVGLEGHGREVPFEGLSLARTTGWCTVYFPFLLPEPDGSPGPLLKAVKEARRAVPGSGLGYGLLRYSAAQAPDWIRERDPGISFNYLGQLDRALAADSPFVPASEPAGPNRAPHGLRTHLIDLSAQVLNGQLTVSWMFSANLHARRTVETWARSYLHSLRTLIAHCLSAAAGGFTPSDFPLAILNPTQLDRLYREDPEIEDVYPLSPMQQGMLFQSLYKPEEGAYYVQVNSVLEGRLNPDAFFKAWQWVVDRHPALRTYFLWQGLDEPLQAVRRRVALPFHSEDWRHKTRRESERELASLAKRDLRLGFRPDKAPLMRLTLIRLDDARYHFTWSNHHLLLDGWCRPLILREVTAAYRAILNHTAPILEPVQPFRDYIAWLRGRDRTAAESFWRAELADLSGATRFSPVPGARGSGFHARDLEIGAAPTAGLKRLVRARGWTLNSLLQGVWSLWLAVETGARDLVFGATVSGRPTELEGADRIVGLFINTLPVRARLEPRQGFGDWLSAFQARQVEARQYDYLPLSQIQAWSGFRAGVLFESILVFNNYPPAADPTSDTANSGGDQPSADEDWRLPGISGVMWTNTYSNVPLIAVVSPGETLTLHIRAERARFDTAWLDRMDRELTAFCLAVAEDPDRPMSHWLGPAGSDRTSTPVEAEEFNFNF